MWGRHRLLLVVFGLLIGLNSVGAENTIKANTHLSVTWIRFVPASNSHVALFLQTPPQQSQQETGANSDLQPPANAPIDHQYPLTVPSVPIELNQRPADSIEQDHPTDPSAAIRKPIQKPIPQQPIPQQLNSQKRAGQQFEPVQNNGQNFPAAPSLSERVRPRAGIVQGVDLQSPLNRDRDQERETNPNQTAPPRLNPQSALARPSFVPTNQSNKNRNSDAAFSGDAPSVEPAVGRPNADAPSIGLSNSNLASRKLLNNGLTTNIRVADQALKNYQFARALKLYQAEIKSLGTGQVPLNYSFRLALAMLGNADPVQAEIVLWRIVNQPNNQKFTLFAEALLANATAAQGRVDLAKNSAYRIFLRVDDLEETQSTAENKRRQVVLALTTHVLAEINLKMVNATDNVVAPQGRMFLHPKLDYISILEFVDSGQVNKTPLTLASQRSDVLSVKLLSRPTSSPSLINFSVFADEAPLLPLLSELEKQAGLNFQVTDASLNQLTARSVTIRKNQITLAELLDAVLAPVNFCWFDSAKGVRILDVAEIDVASKKQYFVSASKRAQQLAMRYAFDAKSREEHLLTVANLSGMNLDFDQAMADYRQVLRSTKELKTQACVRFNIAKLLLNLGRIREAQNELLDLMGRSGNPKIFAAINHVLSRSYLMNGQLNKAVRQLRKASATNDTAELRTETKILTAIAYLLSAEPHSANQVLLAHAKRALATDRELVLFLSAYANYLSTPPALLHSRQRARVAKSLGNIKNPHTREPYVVYLISQACRDIGLDERANRLLADAFDTSQKDFWSSRVRDDLYDTYRARGEIKPARALLQQSMQVGDESQLIRATIELAELDYEEGFVEKSILLCEVLLDPTKKRPLKEDEKKQVLQLLGKSYQNQKKFYLATLCFAGLIPSQELVEQERKKQLLREDAIK